MTDTAASPEDLLPYFDIPLNLQHAGNIAARICRLLEGRGYTAEAAYMPLLEKAQALEDFLLPYRMSDDDAEAQEAEAVRQKAAVQGRELVAEIEKAEAGDDRLGQCIRNLFECLEMGREAMILSLRAGENPHSLQRPG